MDWMILPILACAVIVLTLGWFGLHVLERGVIFVDLALAQVAALGTTWAVYLGHEPEGHVAFGIALCFSFVGAIAFSAARVFEARVPQEAIIGIAYAVSAALGILLVHFAADPHGGEKIEHLLVGNLVWIQPREVAVLAGVCAAVGVVHALVSRHTLRVTFAPEDARAEGMNIAAWDVFFYLSFGLALAAIVSASGVLLVFSYLVIPAVVARLFFRGVRLRLIAAWTLGLAVSVAGVSVSYEHPPGPVIVAFFGGALAIALAVYALRAHGSRALAGIGAGALAVAVVLGGSAAIPASADHDHAEHHEEGDDHDHPAEAPLPTTSEAPAEAAQDDFARLDAAVVAARGGDVAGLRALAALCASDTPFVRVEADTRLRALAGSSAPAYDPLAGPDSGGAWTAWASGLVAMPPGEVPPL